MIRIVAYAGSRNPRSTTLQAIHRTREALDRTMSASWTVITPNDLTILPSDGTASEFLTGVDRVEESGRDDSALLKRLFEECDYLILGTPTYGRNVSGDMKILMDRITYWSHLFRLANKPGMVFVSATTNGFLEVGALMERFMESLGMVVDETAYHTSLSPFDDMKAESAAENIRTTMERLRFDPVLTPSESQEQTFRLYRRMYRSRNGDDYESRYWISHGMCDCDSLHEYFGRVAGRSSVANSDDMPNQEEAS